MKKSLWLQLIGLSLVITLATSSIFFAIFDKMSATAMLETRKNIYLFLAHIIEESPYTEGIARYERLRHGAPALGGAIWVLSESGGVIAANNNEPPPAQWQTMVKPTDIHGMSFMIPRFRHFADLILVRLNANRPTYLLVKPSARTPNKTVAQIEILLSFAGLLSATFSGLAMLVFYLRKTSHEAKDVMSRLHAGDLHARFSIRRVDEIGNLKLDFNAMADEIEKLVQRVQKTETARKNLLQELSHDLRTPLTSLRTSVETLVAYREQMSSAQQTEFLAVIQGELNYFVQLLEDLFFVADIAEPGYAKTRERVDVAALISSELNARQLTRPDLHWQFDSAAVDAMILGDSHLLQRLLRNTLDNAGKYATSAVTVALEGNETKLALTIADDGAGMSCTAIESFGTRRKHRVQSGASAANLSLGLGSVIIKAIVELHGGTLRIQSSACDAAIAQGTRFIFSLPRA